MELYLVRHAEAIEQTVEDEDGQRWLTAKGRKTMQKTARRLYKKKARPELIITSPLVRAVQTAELLMVEFGNRSKLVADRVLAPETTPETLAAFIREQTGCTSLMLVGHEPLLSRTAALLLELKQAPPGLAKAACLRLKLGGRPDRPADFVFYAAPGRKLITSGKKALAPRS